MSQLASLVSNSIRLDGLRASDHLQSGVDRVRGSVESRLRGGNIKERMIKKGKDSIKATRITTK